jgi:F-type H+-transporting ATPase subunit alpha
VGGAAQLPSIRKLGGGVRIALAQFRELEAFAQFASDLDDASREQLEQGQKVTEVMKQKQYSPMSVGEMSVMLFAVNEGYMKDVELNKVADFESALLSFMASEYKKLMANLDETGEYSDEVLASFKEALEKFKSSQTW